MILCSFMIFSDGCSSGDDFTELLGDLSLTSLVELESEFIQHFSGILGGIFHSIHSGTSLTGQVVQKCVV